MSFDNSRNKFNPLNDFAAVVMEQGKVQTDADWNESLYAGLRREQAATLDALGRAVYPASTPFAFQIMPTAAKDSFTIGRGRMYVDGILVENHGVAKEWDPALAELSGTPQPPPTKDTDPVDFTKQPWYPGATLPVAAGDYLCSLDVWRSPVTSIQAPDLIDAAIGIETTGRLRTQWRVNLVPATPGTTCATAVVDDKPSSGRLTNGTIASPPSGPCCLSTGSGYDGPENQFYRVEIHHPGGPGGVGATFKYSRENASVQTTVSSIEAGSNAAGNPASVLTVASLGRDQVLGFSAGDWIELTTDTRDKLSQPGELYQIDLVDPGTMTITLTTKIGTLPAASEPYTRIIRWDQAGKVLKGDNVTVLVDLNAVSGGVVNGAAGIPVPTDGSSVLLESGIIVTFDTFAAPGSFHNMDYWNFSARTATGQIDPLNHAPPRGQHHHRVLLSVVTVDAAGKVTGATDCRVPIATTCDSSGCGCCTATVGEGGKYSSIQDAIDSLPTHGGEVCLLPGDFYEDVLLSGLHNIVIKGCKWQTQVFSASLAAGAGAVPAAAPAAPPAGASPVTQSGLAAVFTIVNCVNVEFIDLIIRADDDAVGVLIDRTPDLFKQPKGANNAGDRYAVVRSGQSTRNVILKELIVAASTLPAILVLNVMWLKIAECRILMKDVRSIWPAVYLSGQDIYFRNNWVGMGSAAQFDHPSGVRGAAPVVATDPAVAGNVKHPAKSPGKGSRPLYQVMPIRIDSQAFASGIVYKAAVGNGGVQIGGPSRNVYVLENEIVGGQHNGITLGNFIVLDAKGHDTGATTGIRWAVEEDCSPGGTVEIPGHPRGGGGGRLVAGGMLENIHLNRNFIHEHGMAGIGMVGFWNLLQELEAIDIVDLSIIGNKILRTMLRQTALINSLIAGFAYGAITLADVENLIVSDNVITDFGKTPASDVCGIFLLHGQMVEISRNQIRESRDFAWDGDLSVTQWSATRAGISLALVTPPTIDSISFISVPGNKDYYGTKSPNYQKRSGAIFQEGLPALRIEENIVRVAFDLALRVFGYGPFAISDNHLASGGPVMADLQPQGNQPYTTGESGSTQPGGVAGDRLIATQIQPLLVQILNFGLGVELVGHGGLYAELVKTYDAAGGTKSSKAASPGNRGIARTGTGAVHFTDNLCQLEATDSAVTGLCSVEILTLDDLAVNDNHLWIQADQLVALTDGFFLGMTLRMCDNRFQESLATVYLSALSLGALGNISADNISTSGLMILAPAGLKVSAPNVP